MVKSPRDKSTEKRATSINLGAAQKDAKFVTVSNRREIKSGNEAARKEAQKTVTIKTTQKTYGDKNNLTATQINNMKKWAKFLKIDEAALKKLQDKYGEYSYNLMQRAMMEPVNMKDAIGYKNRTVTSKGVVEHLINNDLTEQQLKQALNSRKYGRQYVATKVQTATQTKEQAPSQRKLETKVVSRISTKPTPQSSKSTEATLGRVLVVGDSRSINMACSQGVAYKSKIDASDKNGNCWFAEEGKGLSWMKNNITRIRELAKDCDTIEINLGVNDIGNNPKQAARKYVEYINTIASQWKAQGKKVVFTSVNPVDDKKSKTVKNKYIDEFNALMKAGLSSDVIYVDTNSKYRSNLKTDDMGLHYPLTTNRNIYETIQQDSIATLQNKQTTVAKKTPTTTKSKTATKTATTTATKNTTTKTQPANPNKNLASTESTSFGADPASNYKELETAAYKNFGQIEGKYSKLYLDCAGNPTIGVGHLVVPMSGINNKETVKAYKEKYLALPLKDNNGKPLTAEQKAIQFDFIVEQTRLLKTTMNTKKLSVSKALAYTQFKAESIPGAGYYIKAPQITSAQLDENGIRQVFNGDFKTCYDGSKRYVRNFDSYPLPVQLAVAHTTFNKGNAMCFKNKTTQQEVCQTLSCSYRNKVKQETIDAARVVSGLPPKYDRAYCLNQTSNSRMG